jgi:AcrR family transcriptional regulator
MKDDILSTAANLFLNLGFKGVTMDDIAHEMGISKKTIYEHYDHKTELVQEVSFYLLNQIFEGVNAIIKQNKNPIEELYDIKKYVLQHLKGEKSSAVQQLQKYYPKIYKEIHLKQFSNMQSCVCVNLTRGIEQGLFRKNLEVDFISRIYFIGITGLKDVSIFSATEFPPAALHEQYLEYHLRGIVTSKGREILLQLINVNQDL